jgi:hypothetical protein
MGISSGNRNGNRTMQINAPIVAKIPMITAPMMGNSSAKMQQTAKITMAQMPNAQPAAVAAMVMPRRGISRKCHNNKRAINKTKNETRVLEWLLWSWFDMVSSLFSWRRLNDSLDI